LAVICPPALHSWLNPADIYSADNPAGNLLTNGLLDGTAGTETGTGASGDTATGWTLWQTSGAGTTVGSKTTITLPNGATCPAQTITITGAATSRIYQQLLNSANLTVGDSLVADVHVSMTSPVNVSRCSVHLDDNSGLSAEGLHNTPNFYFPAVDWSGVLSSPPMVLTSKAAVTCYFVCNVDTGGSVTAQISRMALRKV
jgi:hypothetical protein